MNDIEMIPLGKLRLSDANVRKNDSNLFIEELAANIEAKGLLQNLIVAPAKKRGMFDVTAGGRRLRALNFLLEALVQLSQLQQITILLAGQRRQIPVITLQRGQLLADPRLHVDQQPFGVGKLPNARGGLLHQLPGLHPLDDAVQNVEGAEDRSGK